MANVLGPSRRQTGFGLRRQTGSLDPQAAIQFVAKSKDPGHLFYPLNGIFLKVNNIKNA